jgi:hypothetical protein
MLASTQMLYVLVFIVFLSLIFTIVFYPSENKYDKTKKRLRSIEYTIDQKTNELMEISELLNDTKGKLTKESLQYTLDWLYRNQLIDYNQYNELMLKSLAYIK